MSGTWIKMGTDLQTHPKVVRMASALKADGCPDRLRVIGALHAVWCLFDAHSEDGALTGYAPEVLDELIGFPGFAAAMIAVGWAEFDGQSLVLPRFGVHNGQSAKRRAMEADRKREGRKTSAPDADETRTREEKRREDLKAETSSLEQPAAARSRFADFWAVYPKKVGKKPAEAKWKAKRLDGIAERLIEDVRKRQAEDGRWLDGFVPDPKTYLTQERWEDELQPRRDAPHAAAAFKADSGPSPARESESPLERAIAWAQQQFRYGQIDATERDRLIGVATEKHRERAPA